MKFSANDFFSKCEQIHNILRIWLHFLKKSLEENLIICTALYLQIQYKCKNRHYVKSVRMRENADQNNSEYEHFLCSDTDQIKCSICCIAVLIS